MLYERLEGNSVRCFLCRHECRITEGQRGLCRVRENRGGILYSIFYGKPVALSVDPIEKKPLFHFQPGTSSLSIATLGCNFQCEFCQNWDISQYGRMPNLSRHDVSGHLAPETVVQQALRNGCASISYTYSEPTIFLEYARDIGLLARQRGIRNVFVTNGYMTPEAIEECTSFLDAANVDLKAFRNETYRKLIKGNLEGVLDSIRLLKEKGIWIEITTLIVPGMNDGLQEISDIARFVASVDKAIPWHISRFYPNYRFSDREMTPMETLEGAHRAGLEAGLNYVYLGSSPGHDSESTYCPGCRAKLIERVGWRIRLNRIGGNGACPDCQRRIDGVFP